MTKFIVSQLILPFRARWGRGVALLLLWTVAFVALPAISGWFLAMCSVAFVAANVAFSYLVPSAVIRLLALVRTATRYFERLENHKTTLRAQQRLQLKVFLAAARLPYFRKQVKNNTALLDNSTQGIDQILNHILLWLLPLTAFVLAVVLYAAFVGLFAPVLALEFLVSSALLLFIVPRLFYRENSNLYTRLKLQREANDRALVESFRGRIEITKYHLESQAVAQCRRRLEELAHTEQRLQNRSFYLQTIVGLGFGLLATLLLWHARSFGIDAPTAIGLFLGMMAQAELAEMLFAGKSERNAVAHRLADLDALIGAEAAAPTADPPTAAPPPMETLSTGEWQAQIPETGVHTHPITLHIRRGEWIAIFGATGKGKTTLLNSLFYPEYRHEGKLLWNGHTLLAQLPVPACIYVAQKAYLLTGTLRENFRGHPDEAVEQVLQLVDLADWRRSLPEGLDTWIGENGETLSGGQRKRLLIAQALLKEPQLLVVDEPTAGISAEKALLLFQNIRRRYPHMTILMATHLHDFAPIVDKVVHL